MRYIVIEVAFVVTSFLVASSLASADLVKFRMEASEQVKQSSLYAVPEGHSSGFILSADYPNELPSREDYPWESIDLFNQPEAYLRAVLDYVVEGNLIVDWHVQNNEIRKWYHAPWMHYGRRGREPIHGLTLERSSRPYELHSDQSMRASNWAIGFYNAQGGYILGQVWRDPAKPATENVLFPNGTVSAKVLFTTATTDQVPYLNGAPAWFADIRRSGSPVLMRLLQLDVAVRDNRVDAVTGTGWVFGTFMYHTDVNEPEPWKRLLPVGIMWGNDPSLTVDNYADGQTPQEGWMNPAVVEMFEDLPRENLGLWGRVNGPVDNPRSSCLACHARALDIGESMRRVPFAPENDEDATIAEYFKNRTPTEAYFEGFRSLDYSLQLGDGIANFREWVRQNHPEHIEYIYPQNQDNLTQV